MLFLAASLLLAAFVLSHLGFASPSKYVAWCGFFVFLLANLGVGRWVVRVNLKAISRLRSGKAVVTDSLLDNDDGFCSGTQHGNDKLMHADSVK